MSRRLATLLFLLFPLLSAPIFAQDAEKKEEDSKNASWYYVPTGANSFGPPSGLLFPSANSETKPFTTNVTVGNPTPEDLTSVQGCGGIGQADYTSALFNMPEVFDKFKRDANSELAKQILTYNYSLPQTAALFDTLNSYGNARYQQFQQSCKLDSLKQDAKNQYMAACVKEQIGKRKNIVSTALDNANTAMSNAQNQQQQSQGSNVQQSANLDTVNSDDQKNAQIYAQAWEMCSLQYTMNKDAITMRKKADTQFITLMRATENVNEAIKPLICAGTTDNSNPACWINLFIPQVRICNGEDLSAGCKGATGGDETTGYGVKEPIIGVSGYFDLLRFIMVNGVNETLIDSLDAELTKNTTSPAIESNAANRAAARLAIDKRDEKTPTDPITKSFQLGYLSCRSSDIAYPLNAYRKALNEEINATKAQSGNNAGSDGKITEDVKFETADYKKIIDEQITLPDGLTAEKEALVALTETALGCTANQVVPIYDPHITESINSCSNDDWDAYYTMAGYDVSLSATRDVYRFIALRLKQAYARLLNEKGAGINQTLVGGGTAPANLVDSPEIRARLARAIKEVMLPSIETNIQRLEELEKTRGAFGQRVQKIYTDRRGCITSPL